jgi:TRAP-type C4-dicarboxylate transport system substrate-binding protein
VRPTLLVALLLSATASAVEPVTLRFATVAPDGTPWARELRAFANDIAAQTEGRVRLKLIFGSIAGDEQQMAERANRGQLDGVASGMWCSSVSPSLRVLRLAGLLQTTEQASYVITRLRPRVDQDFERAGWINLAEVVLGATLTFSRKPAHTFAEMRAMKMWRWDLDDVGLKLFRQMGFDLVGLPVETAGRAYDDGRIDGFYGIPGAALVFQWSTKARYFIDLPLDYLVGCIVMKTSTWDHLLQTDRVILKAASAKVAVRAKEAVEDMNNQLVGRLFEKQGLIKIPVSEQLSAEFFAAAHQARKEMGDKLVPHDVLAQVLEWIADYQTERATAVRRGP